MRTSFHHQPEAQHPKSPAIETPAGRLPHLLCRFSAAGMKVYRWAEAAGGRKAPMQEIA
jgi:hypothetical protein